MKILGLGVPELVIILVVVLLIFGPTNLPTLGASLGKTVKSLPEGMAFDKQDDEADEEIVEFVEDEPAAAHASALLKIWCFRSPGRVSKVPLRISSNSRSSIFRYL